MPFGDQLGGGRPGADDARVPEPFVDPLAIHEVRTLLISRRT
jgi:hypothetical protein